MITQSSLCVAGNDLSLADILDVSRTGRRVYLSDSSDFLAGIERSRNIIDAAVAAGELVYGVNTNVGGPADGLLGADQTARLGKTYCGGSS